MSKGGSTSTSVEIPKYIEDAAKRNLNRAEGIAGLGYVPYYGADVAAFTPMQEAAFGSTNLAAGAFGMPTVGASELTGMPEAETFAGGMRGYSSAPMYEQSLQELQARRPGQYEYMQGFFIDPVTGERGAMMQDPIDYTTGEAPVNATSDGGGGSGSSGMPGSAGGSSFTTYGGSQDIAGQMIDDAYSDYGAQITAGTAKPEDNPAFAADIAAANQQFANMTSDDFNQPGLSMADQYRMAGQSMGAAGIRNVGGSYAQGDPTTGPLGATQDVMGAITTTRDNFASDLGQSLTTDVDLPGNVISRALNVGAGKKDSSSDSGYAGDSDDGCVIATHAVSSGGFTPQMKREAVVWCMHNLHDKWWGEAIRRGYRYLGKQKIEQGKAHEHYQEFRDYIAFANGKKRTLISAIKFTLRTAQFFAVGMIKKDA